MAHTTPIAPLPSEIAVSFLALPLRDSLWIIISNTYPHFDDPVGFPKSRIMLICQIYLSQR
jgi:hypothetical protein